MPSNDANRNGARPGSRTDDIFLSPDWIHRVVDTVEAAQKSNSYSSDLVSDVTLTVVYIINGVPHRLAHWYGSDGQAILSVCILRGAVQRIELGGEPPASGEAHLMVTVEYEIARRLLSGELRLASTFINNGVTAKPMNGLRKWPALAAKSVVMASRALRAARRVPTEF